MSWPRTATKAHRSPRWSERDLLKSETTHSPSTCWGRSHAWKGQKDDTSVESHTRAAKRTQTEEPNSIAAVKFQPRVQDDHTCDVVESPTQGISAQQKIQHATDARERGTMWGSVSGGDHSVIGSFDIAFLSGWFLLCCLGLCYEVCVKDQFVESLRIKFSVPSLHIQYSCFSQNSGFCSLVGTRVFVHLV